MLMQSNSVSNILKLKTFLALINTFHTTGLFQYPLKASENQRFSDVLGDIERDQWHEMG